jgi:hypothetical protein
VNTEKIHPSGITQFTSGGTFLGAFLFGGEGGTMDPLVFRLRQSDYRQQFADFLDRLAIAPVDKEEWQSFIITHYPDEFVEDKRRCCVRLASGYLDQEIDTAEGKKLLRDWAQELRTM